MMQYIFLGGIFVSLIAASSWSIKIDKVFFISIFFTLLPFLNVSLYFTTIFLACTYRIFENTNYAIVDKFLSTKKRKNIFFTFLFIISVFLGAFPSGELPTNFYSHFTVPVLPEKSYMFYHYIGAFFFFVSIQNLYILKKFFESNLCNHLAKISYSVYIFHTLFIVIEVPVFNKITELTGNYIISTVFYLILSLTSTIIVSEILTRFVFAPFSKLVNKKQLLWEKIEEPNS